MTHFILLLMHLFLFFRETTFEITYYLLLMNYLVSQRTNCFHILFVLAYNGFERIVFFFEFSHFFV